MITKLIFSHLHLTRFPIKWSKSKHRISQLDMRNWKQFSQSYTFSIMMTLNILYMFLIIFCIKIYFINCWYIIASNILCWTLYLRPLFLQQFGFYMSQKQQVNIIMRAFVGLFSSLIQNLNFVLYEKRVLNVNEVDAQPF